jgi:hypothetical protein
MSGFSRLPAGMGITNIGCGGFAINFAGNSSASEACLLKAWPMSAFGW